MKATICVARRYCQCGATFEVRSAERVVLDLLGLWRVAHSGSGHEPTDAQGASNARRRQNLADAEASR